MVHVNKEQVAPSTQHPCLLAYTCAPFQGATAAAAELWYELTCHRGGMCNQHGYRGEWKLEDFALCTTGHMPLTGSFGCNHSFKELLAPTRSKYSKCSNC